MARRNRPLLLLLLMALASRATDAVVQQKLFGLTSGLAYYVQLHVGQPLYSATSASSATNKFNLLVDTGSANTAVVTADCCALTNTALYACAASSSCVDSKTSVSVSYITGAWTGELVKDTFSGDGLAPVAGVPFAAIQDESNFIQTGYDGIVGLGYAAIGSPAGKAPTPYFDAVRAAAGVADVFSLLLCGSLQMLTQRNATSAATAENAQLHAGEMLLGGTAGANGERYHAGELAYTPLVQAKWFNVLVTDVQVAGASLALPCKAINTPRSIVDSGTSNIAFPSAVYSAVLAQLKVDVRKVLPSAPDSFFDDDAPCCSALCDPTDAGSAIYSLPALALALAVDGRSEQITVSIPPEYIWRPILLATTTGGVRACRVFGISEGDITLLGDVFMDGLFTVHDRAADRLGVAVAASCPNGVASRKTVTVEPLAGGADSLCDCVSAGDKKSSLLGSWFPLGSSKPCFFWQWWMYVVLVCVFVILLAIGIVFWIAWRRRKLLKELHQVRAQQQQQPTTTVSLASTTTQTSTRTQRQVSEDLERNLLTPQSRLESHDAELASVPTQRSSKHSASSVHSGYQPPSAVATSAGLESRDDIA
ncbi:hypothetical protein PybrP1_010614 [[Pythium] brassicae (nom. inval.)]|nr:hypothetical protein PybrP1_010614 [[Pythium] brassicae (nom. inval.)]